MSAASHLMHRVLSEGVVPVPSKPSSRSMDLGELRGGCGWKGCLIKAAFRLKWKQYHLLQGAVLLGRFTESLAVRVMHTSATPAFAAHRLHETSILCAAAAAWRPPRPVLNVWPAFHPDEPPCLHLGALRARDHGVGPGGGGPTCSFQREDEDAMFQRERERVLVPAALAWLAVCLSVCLLRERRPNLRRMRPVFFFGSKVLPKMKERNGGRGRAAAWPSEAQKLSSCRLDGQLIDRASGVLILAQPQRSSSCSKHDRYTPGAPPPPHTLPEISGLDWIAGERARERDLLAASQRHLAGRGQQRLPQVRTSRGGCIGVASRRMGLDSRSCVSFHFISSPNRASLG